MRLSTTRLNKILLIALYVTIVIIFELLVMASDSVPLNLLALISLILLILSLFIITKSENNILSFRNVFMVLSFVFHLGQVVLILFGYNTVIGYDMRGYTNEYFYSAAVIFTIRVHIFLFFGMMLGGKAKRKYLINRHNKFNRETCERNDLRAIFYTGITLFIIGIIPRLYIDISKVILYLQGNYLSTTTLYFSGVLVIVAGLTNVGILLMLVGKQTKKKFCRKLISLALIYNVLFMITGNRGESVITILMLIYVYYSIVQDLKIKNIIVICFSGYIFLSIITFVAETRHLVDRSSVLMFETLIDSLFNKSPITLAIAEFGVTIKTVFYSIEFFPSLERYSYGTNYIKSIFVALPNVGGKIRQLVMSLTYIYYFPNHQVMGGSYIGEMYYAAGNLGVVIAFIIGIILGALNRLYWFSKEDKNWLRFSLVIVIFTSLLWWIRDYFYVMVREVVWVTILITIIYKVAKGSIRNKNKISAD